MGAVTASGVDVILFYGTLLGLVRGGDFVDGDDDVDVLIAHADLPRLARAVVDAPGLRGVTLGTWPRQLYQVYAGDVGPFDVYTYRLLDATSVLIDWETTLHDARDVFPTTRVVFHGHEALVPRAPHRLLREIYGETYMTPMAKGSYADSVAVRRVGDLVAAFRESADYESARPRARFVLCFAAVCALVAFGRFL
jgi:hypothetical protein